MPSSSKLLVPSSDLGYSDLFMDILSKAYIATTRSSATTEKQRISYAYIFLGWLTDRAIH